MQYLTKGLFQLHLNMGNIFTYRNKEHIWEYDSEICRLNNDVKIRLINVNISTAYVNGYCTDKY